MSNGAIVSSSWPSGNSITPIRFGAGETGAWQALHGVTGWNTIAAGFVFRVNSNGANLTGAPQIQCGFKSNASALPFTTNPGHWYRCNIGDATWTWGGSAWSLASYGGLFRNQNGTSAGLVTAGAQSVYGNNSDNNANAAMVVLSKTSPTSYGVVRATGTGINQTLMKQALATNVQATAASILGGTSHVASSYTIDEATYGVLDTLFFYASGAATYDFDLMWAGVRKWN